MRRGSEIFDPYCRFCGRYKGVGPCLHPDCPTSLYSVREKGVEIASRRVSADRGSAGQWGACHICNETKSVACSVCGRGFCSQHSLNRLQDTMTGPDHYVGTCTKCGQLVCENCWILDDRGRISCIRHLEDPNPHDWEG